MSETSRHCDRSEHDQCDGTVEIFDQDGPGRWTCCCSCHNARFNEKDCPHCKGHWQATRTSHLWSLLHRARTDTSMMDDAELAHWRYRVQGLERQVADYEVKIERALRAGGSGSSMEEAYEVLRVMQWLLEEARYKVCLGDAERLHGQGVRFVVIDWDREELVGSAYSSIAAQDIKEQHCDDVGIARDDEHDEPRHRVTIERIEVK